MPHPTTVGIACVALLAEGVDRNKAFQDIFNELDKSPSSRRAWIEIKTCDEFVYVVVKVALLAEGVDRNVSVPA